MNKVEIPLLRDHHNHLSFYGLLYGCPNLQAITDKAEALRLLHSPAKDRVSVAIGWNTGYYRFSAEDLAPLPPVIIVNLSLHSFVLSPAAASLLREDYPEIVANHANPQWYEAHMPQMLIFLANQMEVSEEKFNVFFDSLYRQGVYYVEDMHLANAKVLSVIRSSPFSQRTAFWTDLATFKTLSPEARAELQGIKFFTDGAVGARTAALEHSYTDGGGGYLLFPDEMLFQQLAEAAAFGKAVAVHAIGEKATAQVVRTIKKLATSGMTFPMVRMEHCQFIHEATAREAKELGIIFSMQPNFSTDSTIYADRLLPWYLENNNPFRLLIDRVGFIPGEDLIFGSDGMPHGAEAALNASLFPPFPGQKLTLEEFTAGYCMPDKTHGHIELERDDAGLKSLSVIRPAALI